MNGSLTVAMNEGVCLFMCVWLRVMRPEQHNGKLSQLLMQTHQWVKKTEDGWGRGGDWGKNVEECSVSALQQ